eukprot:XP_014774323.1 PREDICTED: oxalate:formate antiporter-like [Octopus bimaculoides]
MRDRKVAPDLQYNESIWIFAMVLLGQGTTGFLGGMLERLIGPRLTTLAGAWIMSSGVLLTYFSVNHSFASCLITYGLIFGFGVGLAYPIPTGCAMRWMPHRKGFVVGFVVAGYGGGAFIFNQVITGFINPRNLSPDIDHNGEQVKQELRRSQRLKVEWRITATRWKWKQLKVLQRTVRRVFESNISFHFNPVHSAENGLASRSGVDRAFGQTFIQDDRFHSLVGAFASLCNAGGRILWGAIADRTSFRTAQLAITSLLTCLYSTFIITEYGGKPLFFIWVCLIFLTFSGSFSTFPSCTMRCFGEQYYSINYGLLFTSQAMTAIIGSLLSENLLPLIGWMGLFFVAAVISACAIVIAFNFKEPPS